MLPYLPASENETYSTPQMFPFSAEGVISERNQASSLKERAHIHFCLTGTFTHQIYDTG
jgi:hypothetical protein